ncbi:cytochrome c1 [Litorivicinus lipolyticus]|uniref:cytochrome c1 n=1 Tax=Litorivicinus lipolyticus TaxID=418701 RepID=UPI003B5B81C4
MQTCSDKGDWLMIKGILLALTLVSGAAVAAGGSGYPLEHIDTDVTDQPSLQRGLATYSQFCAGCHSMEYQRYERTANDLGISNALFEEHLLPGHKKIGDLGTISMPADAAGEWFGAPPPDLTLVTRKRGNDWVYTYLKTFYTDPSRPLGVNNLVFPKVGMPHALQPLQGEQRLVCTNAPVKENGVVKTDPLTGNPILEDQCGVLEVVEGSGQLSADEYDRVIYDLVNYMAYVAEPSRAQSERLGIYVLLFLFVFFIVAYLLKREYWKDVH